MGFLRFERLGADGHAHTDLVDYNKPETKMRVGRILLPGVRTAINHQPSGSACVPIPAALVEFVRGKFCYLLIFYSLIF